MNDRRRRWLTGAIFALTQVAAWPLSAQVIVNRDTTTYDSHPSAATTRSGATWVAWQAYRNSRDQILAVRLDEEDAPSEVQIVSEGASVHGPPSVVARDDDAAVVWATKHAGRWRIVIRLWRNGAWDPARRLSAADVDAIHPTAMEVASGILVAWSENKSGRWRVRGRVVRKEGPSTAFDISPSQADAFRPTLVDHNRQVWCFWDQYRRPNYAVLGRVVFPERLPIERVSSSPDANCLTPTALSHKSGLHVAWLQKVDVRGRSGVISQWHTLHAAVRRQDGWQPIKTRDGENAAAELTHGLMAKTAPRPVATGGYLGARTRPMLLADDERVWLLWERKSDHRGSTPRVAGDLVGRPSVNARWETPVVLHQGLVDYHLLHPPLARAGAIRALASRLPQRGLRRYEVVDGNLREARPFEQDEWMGWGTIRLPVQRETPPRRSVDLNGKTYQLYWADLHCHNGLTADAEGEPDEAHFYARDRAALDVVVFTNNDFYNVPLTQYDFELGNLLARTFSARKEGGAKPILSLPGFEWTSRIPGDPNAKLSDPGNWLPPYRNRSFPNHRSVIYPPSGGPLVHFTEVGNDIARLNDMVELAGGVTLSQHNAFKLSGHPVEVGFELTSGWSNYIAQRPQLFHGPLSRGARLGFTANGDTHRRAPGLSGALTAIYAESLTADAILNALRERRCYATMGSKIFLDARAGDAFMGGEAKAINRTIELKLHAIGTRHFLDATLIRDGESIHQVEGRGNELKVAYTDDNLATGTHWYYWRVRQAGFDAVLPGNLMPAHGPLAWSSPIWVVVE